MQMFTFHPRYFLAFLLLFLTELGIAFFLRDTIIRPYLGDVLVVILLYSLLKAFLKIHTGTAALGVLVFAFLIEMLQFFNIVDLLGLQNNKIASTVLGNHFDWLDILAYTVGVALVLIFERKIRPIKK